MTSRLFESVIWVEGSRQTIISLLSISVILICWRDVDSSSLQKWFTLLYLIFPQVSLYSLVLWMARKSRTIEEFDDSHEFERAWYFVGVGKTSWEPL